MHGDISQHRYRLVTQGLVREAQLRRLWIRYKISVSVMQIMISKRKALGGLLVSLKV